MKHTQEKEINLSLTTNPYAFQNGNDILKGRQGFIGVFRIQPACECSFWKGKGNAEELVKNLTEIIVGNH